MASGKIRVEVGGRKVMAGNTLLARGAVVEADEGTDLGNEFKGLVQAGYAKNSTKALSDGAPENKSATGDTSLLDGTVAEVTEGLAGLDAASLKALRKAEGKGKDRAGVHAAIDAAEAALPAE